MTITLCCSHQVDDFDDEVCLSLKDQAIDYYEEKFVRAISYGGYCKKCADEYEKLGIVLHNEQEEQDWLSGKMPDADCLP